MEIVKATLNDLDEISALFDAYRVFYGKGSAIEKANSFLSKRIENGESEIFLAIANDGKAVGFTQLYPLFSSTRMKRLWLLNDLYVAPEFRGQGISKLLIERAKELARATRAAGISLETDKNNDIGNQLYPRTEFELDDHNFYFWENDLRI